MYTLFYYYSFIDDVKTGARKTENYIISFTDEKSAVNKFLETMDNLFGEHDFLQDYYNMCFDELFKMYAQRDFIYKDETENIRVALLRVTPGERTELIKE